MIQYTGFRVERDDSGGSVALTLASRENDGRSYYLRNDLDGRFTPADPQRLARVSTKLAELLPPKTDNEIALGFAEGGLILAASLAGARGSRFACSTKTQRNSTGPVIEFVEGHRNDKPAHFVYALQPGAEVVIVEDEISTGDTVLSAYASLTAADITVTGIASVAEILNFGGRERIFEGTGLPLSSLITLELV